MYWPTLGAILSRTQFTLLTSLIKVKMYILSRLFSTCVLLIAITFHLYVARNKMEREAVL
jgi:hypothetical protein